MCNINGPSVTHWAHSKAQSPFRVPLNEKLIEKALGPSLTQVPGLLRVRNVSVMEKHVHGQLLVLGDLVRLIFRQKCSLFENFNGLVMSCHICGKHSSNDNVSRNPSVLRWHFSQDITAMLLHDFQSGGSMEVFQDCLVYKSLSVKNNTIVSDCNWVLGLN